MGRARDTSPTVVSQIVVLRQEGYTQQQLAQRFGISRSAVQKCLARHQATGSFSARKRGRRPRVTTASTDRVMRRLAVKDPTASSSFIASQLPEAVNPRTVRRRLQHDFGLKAYRPAVTPQLSAKNIKDRMAFAQRYHSRSAADWAATMFSDESIIKQFYSFSTHVRRPSGTRYNPRYTVGRVKNSPSTMIWGSISYAGAGPLYFVPRKTTINAAHYLTILQQHLLPSLAAHSCTTFQQDGAPAHTAVLVRRWLEENNVNVLAPWPGNSPDLNPIENCWAMVKKRVAELRPTSLTDLEAKVRQVWETEVTAEFCSSLIRSMPDRLAAVIKARGGPTKY